VIAGQSQSVQRLFATRQAELQPADTLLEVRKRRILIRDSRGPTSSVKASIDCMLKDAAIKAGRGYDGWPSTIIDGTLILLAIAAGFAFAVHVVGFRVINPFDTSWLSGDAAHSYLGWAFFRHEPLLTFPLGWSAALGYPLGERIAWLDCVPIVALLLWPLKGVLPWDFQYLGLIFAFNCILQLYFGYRISWHLTGHSRLVAIAGALFFLVAPPFILRSSGHFALTSHWLILAALTLYFTSSPGPAKWRLIAGAALCFLAASIHPYIMVMVLLIDAATHLRVAMSRTRLQAPRSACACAGWVFASAFRSCRPSPR
jgi:Family of unknown function (DUF6311)